MKCPQCSRRNSDSDSFCVVCAAPLSQISKLGRKLVPPQDISAAVAGRRAKLPYRSGFLSPLVVFLVLILAGMMVAYWAIYYVDTYRVQAIEYYE